MQDVRQVLDFWFSDQARERWFDATQEFDQTIRKRFAELFARAATGSLRHWEDSPEGCLALCILLDQFPRNMFRGDGRAFGTDDKALRIAEHAVAEGFDHELPAEQKQFLYLPFMHNERLANQLRAIALCESAGLTEARKYAEDHVAIIRQFGRFPHRNVLLGRRSTEAEDAWLSANGTSFGQATGGHATSEGHHARAPSSAWFDSRSTQRSGT